MHPGQVQIFQLWQIYLDNVNPLLKVTHTPTLQPRIIKAVSDMRNISEALDALLFSIYCTAILSMTNDECFASFRLSRDYLLERYQVACKEALLKCSPWRTNNVDALTALYLYLVRLAPTFISSYIPIYTHPNSALDLDCTAGRSTISGMYGRRCDSYRTAYGHAI